MKKNKGFSLTELLAVIIVLAILTIAITPIVDKAVKGNNQKLYDQQVDLIISASKLWGAEHIASLPSEGENGIYVSLGDLKKGGYITQIVINPKTDEAFSESSRVYITNRNGVINYEFLEGV